MDCKRFRELISLWVDGLLDEQEKEYFERHAKNCEQCGIELAEFENMISLMNSMEEVQLPEGFHERLHARLEQEIESVGKSLISGSKPIKLVKLIGAVAAIFVLVFSIRILDSADLLWNKQQVKDNMEISSVGSSDKDSNLNIASISGMKEGTSTSSCQQDGIQEQAQIQEKAAAYEGKTGETQGDDKTDKNLRDGAKAGNDTTDYVIANGDVTDEATSDEKIAKNEILTDKEDEGTKNDEVKTGDVQLGAIADAGMVEKDADVDPESTQDTEKESAEKMIIQFTASQIIDMIKTDYVKVKVQDVCITPYTLKMIAVNNGIEVIRSSEDSVALEVSSIEQRKLLYQELSNIGEIEDIGEKLDSDQVTIVIVKEE